MTGVHFSLSPSISLSFWLYTCLCDDLSQPLHLSPLISPQKTRWCLLSLCVYVCVCVLRELLCVGGDPVIHLACKVWIFMVIMIVGLFIFPCIFVFLVIYAKVLDCLI